MIIFSLLLSHSIYSEGSKKSKNSKDCAKVLRESVRFGAQNDKVISFKRNKANKIQRFLKIAQEEEFSEEEIELLKKGLNSIDFEIRENMLKSFIYFLSFRKDKEKEIAFKNMGEILAGESKHRVGKLFYKIERKIEHYEKVNVKKTLKKLETDNSNNKSVEELKLRAFQIAKKELNLKGHIRVVNQCYSSNMRRNLKDTKQNTARFFKFSLVLTAVFSTISSGVNNWERDFKEWIPELGFDFSFVLFSSFFMSRIIGNQNSSFLKKGVKGFFLKRTLSLGDAVLFHSLFKDNDKNINKELREISKELSPEEFKKIQDEIKKIKNFYIELELLFERFLYLLRSQVDDKTLQQQMKEGEEEFLTKMGEIDINNENVRKTLKKIALLKVYKENDVWIKTGALGSDRFIFHTIYDFLRTPSALLLGLYTYKLLCISPIAQTSLYTKVFMINTLEKFISTLFYYTTRKKAIGR